VGLNDLEGSVELVRTVQLYIGAEHAVIDKSSNIRPAETEGVTPNTMRLDQFGAHDGPMRRLPSYAGRCIQHCKVAGSDDFAAV
jgi:hypothetical protein